MGALSFERRVFAADGSSSVDRRTTFVLDIIDVIPRLYIAGPVFLAFGVDFGLSFYDGPVPFVDFHGGLGFEYGGWGLESGVRTIRLPKDVRIIDGKEYSDSGYGVQLYAGIETNLTLF